MLSRMEEVMRLSVVPRWGIVAMTRTQSVAEHSYNVTMIASEIALVIGMQGVDAANLINYCLIHDMDEAYTGDLPTPMKKNMRIRAGLEDMKTVPSAQDVGLDNVQIAILKMADSVEALQYLYRYCCDRHKIEIGNEIFDRIQRICDDMDWTRHGKELFTDLGIYWGRM